MALSSPLQGIAPSVSLLVYLLGLLPTPSLSQYRHDVNVTADSDYFVCKRPMDFWDPSQMAHRLFVVDEWTNDLISAKQKEYWPSVPTNANVTSVDGTLALEGFSLDGTFHDSKKRNVASRIIQDDDVGPPASPRWIRASDQLGIRNGKITTEALVRRRLLSNIAAYADVETVTDVQTRQSTISPLSGPQKATRPAKDNSEDPYHVPLAPTTYAHPWDEFPDREFQFRLACETGRPWKQCIGKRMPLCARMCQQMCHEKCANLVGPFSKISECIKNNNLEHCMFQYYDTKEVQLDQVCRQVLQLHESLNGTREYGRTGASTTYFFRQSAAIKLVTLPNLKRLQRAAVVFRLEEDFFPGLEGPRDFGMLAMVLPPDQVKYEAEDSASSTTTMAPENTSTEDFSFTDEPSESSSTEPTSTESSTNDIEDTGFSEESTVESLDSSTWTSIDETTSIEDGDTTGESPKCTTTWYPFRITDAQGRRVVKHNPTARWYRRRLLDSDRKQLQREVQIEVDVTPWMKTSLLTTVGGGRDFPWIMLWWPGEQPKFAGDFQPYLKLQTKLGKGNQVSADGFMYKPPTWDLDDHGKSVPRQFEKI